MYKIDNLNEVDKSLRKYIVNDEKKFLTIKVNKKYLCIPKKDIAELKRKLPQSITKLTDTEKKKDIAKQLLKATEKIASLNDGIQNEKSAQSHGFSITKAKAFSWTSLAPLGDFVKNLIQFLKFVLLLIPGFFIIPFINRSYRKSIENNLSQACVSIPFQGRSLPIIPVFIFDIVRIFVRIIVSIGQAVTMTPSLFKKKEKSSLSRDDNTLTMKNHLGQPTVRSSHGISPMETFIENVSKQFNVSKKSRSLIIQERDNSKICEVTTPSKSESESEIDFDINPTCDNNSLAKVLTLGAAHLKEYDFTIIVDLVSEDDRSKIEEKIEAIRKVFKDKDIAVKINDNIRCPRERNSSSLVSKHNTPSTRKPTPSTRKPTSFKL